MQKIGPNGDGKSDVATHDGRSRKKKDRPLPGTLTRLNKRYCYRSLE